MTSKREQWRHSRGHLPLAVSSTTSYIFLFFQARQPNVAIRNATFGYCRLLSVCDVSVL